MVVRTDADRVQAASDSIEMVEDVLVEVVHGIQAIDDKASRRSFLEWFRKVMVCRLEEIYELEGSLNSD